MARPHPAPAASSTTTTGTTPIRPDIITSLLLTFHHEPQANTIKRGFGTNTILAKVEGDADFLRTLPGVRDVVTTSNLLQIKMQPGTDSQSILQAMVPRLRVTHFELTEPSLEEIFIMAVGKVEA